MNMFRLIIIVSVTTLIFFSGQAQSVQQLTSGTNASLRGLSVVSDKVVWVSGSKGTVGLSKDGGNSWSWTQVPGYENRDFRDIEGFDGSTAIVIAVDTPAVILKTKDGGKNWKLVYENKLTGMFLDAMEFWNHESGIVVGDPVNGRFFVTRSFNNGDSWQDIPFDKRPAAEEGEACFAASGTNVRALDRDEACFVSGGKVSRLFWKGMPVRLPLTQGNENQGANSIAVWNKRYKVPHILIVGGDYKSDSLRSGNCVLSRDGGKSWITPSNPPYGYRSCVEFISSVKVITCGMNGVDISLDEGINWNSISHDGYNVCRKAKKGKAVFLGGEHGTVSKLILPE